MNEAMGGWVGVVGAWVNGRVKGENKQKNGRKQESKQTIEAVHEYLQSASKMIVVCPSCYSLCEDDFLLTDPFSCDHCIFSVSMDECTSF